MSRPDPGFFETPAVRLVFGNKSADWHPLVLSWDQACAEHPEQAAVLLAEMEAVLMAHSDPQEAF